MNDFKENLSIWLVNFLKEIGINPIYIMTILALAIVLSYKDEIQDWEELPLSRKGLIISAVCASVVFIISSLLQLIGFIDW